ncbi:MAG: gamma-glutamyltransferase family protein [Phycisphaeraceae bacterium]
MSFRLDRLWMPGTLALSLLTMASFVFAVDSPPQVAVGHHYAVVSASPEASWIGLRVLREGGNVIDAAVAVGMAVGVGEAYGSGLGGKLAMVYRDGETGEVYALEALDRASSNPEVMAYRGLERDERMTGWRSVCVPGMPAALGAMHERWGSRPWGELVRPAAELARRGVVIDGAMLRQFEPKLEYLLADAEAARLYLVNGRLPRVGERLRNVDLAETLDLIADRGVDAFYRGRIAEEIVAAAQAAGAPLTLEDFAGYEVRWSDPLAADYRGYRVFSSVPPTTGGVTILATLKALEGLPAAEFDPRGAALMDQVGRTLFGVYEPMAGQIADVPSARADAEAMLTDAFAGTLRDRAASFDPAREAVADESATVDATTHFIVADSRGNVVSVTQSLSWHFGAAVIAPGTGVLMNNTMTNFALNTADSPNLIGPGQRPRSTIAPTLVTRGDQTALAIGIPGGQRIPTTTLQLLMDTLMFGLSPAEAIDQPRYHLRRATTSRQGGNVIDLEQGMPRAVAETLEEAGWETQMHDRVGRYFGAGGMIRWLPDGRVEATADTRRTNFAVAW